MGAGCAVCLVLLAGLAFVIAHHGIDRTAADVIAGVDIIATVYWGWICCVDGGGGNSGGYWTSWTHSIRYTGIIALPLTIKPIIINTATTPTITYIPILNIQHLYHSLASSQQKYPGITRQRTSLMSFYNLRRTRTIVTKKYTRLYIVLLNYISE